MLVLLNANIYTPYLQEKPTALAIDRDRIIALGSNEAILEEFKGKAQIQDMQGVTIWPGMIDAHIHLQYYASSLQMIDCETPSRSACLERVQQKAQDIQPGYWIRGHGWNHNSWPEGLGNAALLDQIVPQHPVFLTAKSLHVAAWVNSAALRMAGIGPDTPDPKGGVIERDQKGEATGILFEFAVGLVQNIIPPLSHSELVNWLQKAQHNLLKLGITGVHDFDGPDCFNALQELNQTGQLRIKVLKAIHPEFLPQVQSIGLRSGFGDDQLRLGPLKLFADGALGPQTAAMLDPYEGSNSNYGLIMLDVEQILKIGQQATSLGYNLAIHAIGDRANRVVLDAFEQLRKFEQDHHILGLRHRIEHVQIINPVDQPRLSGLHIIASMQPIHAPSDMQMAEHFWGIRSQNAYAWKALQQANVHLVYGSDAPVESPNPFWGIHAAVHRCRRDGTPGKDGWYPHQRLSLKEAVEGFTIGAAYAAGMENRQGKIAPGYYADLIALRQDPFTIPPEDLFKISPAAIMISGEWLHL